MSAADLLRALADDVGRGHLPIDEWGPVCAGCGTDEFRIDGYCSFECRDWHDQQEYADLARWAADAADLLTKLGFGAPELARLAVIVGEETTT